MSVKRKILIVVILVFILWSINNNITTKNKKVVRNYGQVVNVSSVNGQASLHNKEEIEIGNKSKTEIETKRETNKEEVKEIRQNNNINKVVKMEVTAYTHGFESTGKTVSHPEYKITASGNEAKPRYTVSASRDIPFGTRVRIPEYEEYMGLSETVLVVEDRGGAIKKGKIDIYMESKNKALKWGRRKNVDVIFLE